MTMTETKTYKKTNTKKKTHRLRQRKIQSASKIQYMLKAGGSMISNMAFPPKKSPKLVHYNFPPNIF